MKQRFNLSAFESWKENVNEQIFQGKMSEDTHDIVYSLCELQKIMKRLWVMHHFKSIDADAWEVFG